MKKLRIAAYVVLMLIIASMAIYNIHLNNQIDDQRKSFTLENQALKKVINKNGVLVNEQQMIIAEKEYLAKKYADSIFNLRHQDEKKIKAHIAVVSIQQKQKNTVFAQWETPPKDRIWTSEVDSSKWSYERNARQTILVPISFHYLDSLTEVGGTVEIDGVKIDSMVSYNTLSFQIFNTRKGVMVQAINSNPDIQTAGMTSIYVKPKNNWWNRWGKPVAAAIVAGGVTYYLTR